MIEVSNLTKKFLTTEKEIFVLQDITVSFSAAQSYGISGPSGAGKSTLLHCIAGIEKPSSGSIVIDGHQYKSTSEDVRAEVLLQKIGVLFQYPYLIPELTVLENVALKGILSGFDRKEWYERAYDLLQKIGLENRANLDPKMLSGGEQQRVAFVRAIFLEPLFLLADEPTAHLDEKNAHRMIELMVEYQKNHGMGLLVCSHDSWVIDQCDERYNLQNGKLRWES